MPYMLQPSPVNRRRVEVMVSVNELAARLERHRSNICRALGDASHPLHHQVLAVIRQAERQARPDDSIAARRHRLGKTQLELAQLAGVNFASMRSAETRPDQVRGVVAQVERALSRLEEEARQERLKQLPARRVLEPAADRPPEVLPPPEKSME